MATSENPLNFGSGPSKLPKEVLEEAQKEFLNFDHIGFSITELSHRSQEYAKINQEAQDDLRELLSVPNNYKILFTQGGGQALMSAIPLNLMKKNGSADYAITGIWSTIAADEAKKYGKVKYVFPESEPNAGIPDRSTWKLDKDASYFFYCDNETIEGREFPFIPDTEGIPIVSDMSSSLMSKTIDVSKFGVIFAAAQKNLGTAALGVVIIRQDLLGKAQDICPSFLNFSLLDKANSILNTPPVFSVYLLGKVLKWVKRNGGLQEMENRCKKKSKLLYDTIKNSNGFYKCPVQNEDLRSHINVPFTINNGDVKLEEKFIKEADENHIHQLKGHRLVGGVRVSLYNSISFEEVKILTDFMYKFQNENQCKSISCS
ncbi:probable phosphoserine aminotransferase [Sitophilus oryzae]|uniref:phosphoserine transaminase n=1 Tax=Sitophilus oryzae TaxID=7048 RepID=A0A6J2X7Q5_SITOR|nr:probable phosphoserine aminotransferase [Sitophilus oryzae]XP_030747261.1 probable phosphoserine aminotransferase [Sitophilus oryzae]XP_030747262.1 probable phosphoserine aminotransferase [Sitophilus oryzae]XP_030747263.1 probable phosphoserine aminotransferase [Sitophilus oryzae]